MTTNASAQARSALGALSAQARARTATPAVQPNAGVNTAGTSRAANAINALNSVAMQNPAVRAATALQILSANGTAAMQSLTAALTTTQPGGTVVELVLRVNGEENVLFSTVE